MVYGLKWLLRQPLCVMGKDEVVLLELHSSRAPSRPGFTVCMPAMVPQMILMR